MKYSTCVYLKKDGSWLFLLRNKKENDVNQGKYIGVGGKVEKNETYEQCAYREVFEETGLEIKDLDKQGVIEFHYPHVEDETCIIYTGTYDSDIHQKCDEGTLVEVKEEDIFKLDLWEGDRIFLKKMLIDKKKFYYEFYYDQDDRLIRYLEKEL